MGTNQDTVSPLRRRMIEDMTIRHLTPETQGQCRPRPRTPRRDTSAFTADT